MPFLYVGRQIVLIYKWILEWDGYEDNDAYEFVWSCLIVRWDLKWVEKNTLNKFSFTNINSKFVTCYG